MLTIIGKGGFAREVAAYINRKSIREMYELKLDTEVTDEDKTLIIAIGDGATRERISNQLTGLMRYYILNFGTIYGDCGIGNGSIICPGTIITTDVYIGDHVIININCTVGHDCRIGSFTTISPGVNVSGNVTIGKRCYIGTNAVIREKISICDDVVIGAGAVVVKDITEPGIYVGNPCKKIK